MRGDGTRAERRRGIDPRVRAAALTGLMATAAVGCWVIGGWMLLEGRAARAFVESMGMAGVVVVPVAAAATWVYVGGVVRDIHRVTSAARDMVHDVAWGRPVSIRRLDEVGEVTRRIEELRRYCVESVERARRARREAERADREKTEFLTSVSHELRTPLNAIVGFADVLLAEIDGPLNASQREDLATIRGAGLHLVALFTDVLDLSAAASGHLRLERAEVALGPILEAVAHELRGQRRDRPVDIVVQVPSHLPALRADALRLRQVVTNLAGNALKFTEEGEVRLEAAHEGSEIVVTIADTGTGIEPEALATLFDEFTQVGEGPRRLKGTGLGLSISRQLVELHGGTLTVHSTLGQGTTVQVRLPVGGDA